MTHKRSYNETLHKALHEVAQGVARGVARGVTRAKRHLTRKLLSSEKKAPVGDKCFVPARNHERERAGICLKTFVSDRGCSWAVGQGRMY